MPGPTTTASFRRTFFTFPRSYSSSYASGARFRRASSAARAAPSEPSVAPSIPSQTPTPSPETPNPSAAATASCRTTAPPEDLSRGAVSRSAPTLPGSRGFWGPSSPESRRTPSEPGGDMVVTPCHLPSSAVRMSGSAAAGGRPSCRRSSSAPDPPPGAITPFVVAFECAPGRPTSCAKLGVDASPES